MATLWTDSAAPSRQDNLGGLQGLLRQPIGMMRPGRSRRVETLAAPYAAQHAPATLAGQSTHIGNAALTV